MRNCYFYWLFPVCVDNIGHRMSQVTKVTWIVCLYIGSSISKSISKHSMFRALFASGKPKFVKTNALHGKITTYDICLFCHNYTWRHQLRRMFVKGYIQTFYGIYFLSSQIIKIYSTTNVGKTKQYFRNLTFIIILYPSWMQHNRTQVGEYLSIPIFQMM